MSNSAILTQRARSPETRPSIPIKQRYAFELDAAQRQQLSDIAQRLVKSEPALCETEYFGPDVHCGLHVDGPALLFADQSEISLYGAPENMLFEYRMAMLGEVNDVIVLSHDRSRAFEAYLQEYLDIGAFDVLMAAGQPNQRHWPLPKRCLEWDSLFRHIVRRASSTGFLSIVPYLSTGHVWNLARRVAEETGAEIAVTAPPPRLARRINDKVWFANRVKQVFGKSALSPAFTVFGPAALAAHVRRLASESERLVIKIPDSAGSTGNLSIQASDLKGRSHTSIRAHLLDMLANLGWTGTFPLKLEIWETPTLVSPSVQVWIPHQDDGSPIIEGLFEQIVVGGAGKFIGAVETRMPAIWQQRMVEQAMALAFMFQRLGYYGRCSLDALVTGTNFKDAKLHWIECNGRWGGVSVPMTLVNRILPDSDVRTMIVQRLSLQLPTRPFASAIEALQDLLFRRGVSHEGIILLTPTAYERGAGVHLMAISGTMRRTRELAHLALVRLFKT